MLDPQSKYEGGFANNFDVVRLILATSVVFLHFDHLVNAAAVSAVLEHTRFISARAVPAFFVVSGFVVYMSFDRSRNLANYTVSRFLRLYPAYFFVVCAMALTPLLLTGCEGQTVFSPTWWRYLVANLAFLNFVQPTLPCLFEGNFDQTINGALWTLKIEVMFYASVPIIFWLIQRFGGLLVLGTLFVLGAIYSAILLSLAANTGSGLYETLANQLPGQMTYFAMGMLLYLYYGHFAAHWKWLIPLSAVLMLASLPVVEPIVLGIFIIGAATAGVRQLDLSKMGDLSYGIYIFHFPIIQLSIHFGLFENAHLLHFIAILFATFAAAYFSSRLIELPSARLKRKLLGRRPPAPAM